MVRKTLKQETFSKKKKRTILKNGFTWWKEPGKNS